MALELTLRTRSSIPLEVEQVLPQRVRELPLGEIEKLPVLFGNQSERLGEHFNARGSAAEDAEVRFLGVCDHVKRIGVNMESGRVVVEGNPGMHLGAEMRGGEIHVLGNVSDWCGAEMAGGVIRIRGNAGNHVGAAYRGAQRGMTGGEILIEGDCGHEAGHAMRRGLIAAGGAVGDAAGFQMSGGTILAGRSLGQHAGAGLKRGTIAWLGEGSAPQVLATYRRSIRLQPTFLRIFLQSLQQRGFPLPEGCPGAEYRRYCGDFLELGRGEILLREPA